MKPSKWTTARFLSLQVRPRPPTVMPCDSGDATSTQLAHGTLYCSSVHATARRTARLGHERALFTATCERAKHSATCQARCLQRLLGSRRPCVPQKKHAWRSQSEGSLLHALRDSEASKRPTVPAPTRRPPCLRSFRSSAFRLNDTRLQIFYL